MKEESKVKPFYIKYEGWMRTADVGSVLDKAISIGAYLNEGLVGYHQTESGIEVPVGQYIYFGVSNALETYFSDNPRNFGSHAIEIKLDQVDEHLGLTKVDKSADATPQSLVGCKIDLRNEDGTVNSELSAAFQEVCFAQGLTWISQMHHKEKSAKYLDAPFLCCDDKLLGYGNCAKDFIKNSNKEIKFEFERKLNWSVKYMTNETTRKIVDIGGVSYYEDKLLEAVQLLEAAKVVDSGVATPTAGTGTPPDRESN